MAGRLKCSEQWRAAAPPRTMRNVQRCYPTMVEDLYATLPKVKLEVPGTFARANVENSWSAADAIRRQQAEISAVKVERLKQFNDEVRRRVHLLEQLKKQQLLERSFKALELERNIVKRTAFAAESSVPHVAGCIMQDNLDVVIGKGSCRGHGSLKTSLVETKKAECRDALQQEHKRRLSARKKLASMKIGVGSSRNKSPWEASDSERPSSQEHCESVDVSDISWEDVEARTVIKKEVAFELDSPPRELSNGCGESDNLQHDVEEEKGFSAASTSAQAESTTAGLSAIMQQRVILPNIYSTRDQEEIRKQEVKQRATFRRLFMDIERQQVKEFSRQREHHEQIESIRRSKEEERRRQEQLALAEWLQAAGNDGRGRQAAPRSAASHIRDPAAMEEQLQLQEQALQARKALESKRYLAALRETLREKVERLRVQLPPLCLCSSSPWDTHPDLCANNCVFYRNPRGYVAALQNLVATSCEAA